MGICGICDKPAGWLRSAHGECKRARKRGLEFIPYRVRAGIENDVEPSAVAAEVAVLACEGHIDTSTVSNLTVRGMGLAVDVALKRGGLSEPDERYLMSLESSLGVSATARETAPYARSLIMGRRLRSVLSGEPLEPAPLPKGLTLKLPDGEQVVWVFDGVGFEELETRRQLKGGGNSPMREETYQVAVPRDKGFLAFTGRAIRFRGKKYRLDHPLEKISRLTETEDGFQVEIGDDDPEPNRFVTGNAWFAYRMADALWRQS